MQTSVLGNYFKLKTTLGIISWKFLGLKLRYISQKFKGSLPRFSSGSNLFMTGWTLNWNLSLVQEVQVWTLVQNWTMATLPPASCNGLCQHTPLASRVGSDTVFWQAYNVYFIAVMILIPAHFFLPMCFLWHQFCTFEPQF